MKTIQNQEAKSLKAVEEEIHNSLWAAEYIHTLSNVPARVFELLYSTENTASAIQSMLRLLGETNKVSRVYIFEDDPDHLYSSNTFEWCAEGIPSEMDKLVKVSYEALGGAYLDNFDATGVFFCPDISTLDPVQYEFLKTQGIVAMLQAAIIENGEFQGFIGFDDCAKAMEWTEEQIHSLIIISKIISTFLRKMRREEAVAEANRKLQSSLEQIRIEHQRLLENEHRLRLITQNTSVSMWENDIKNKTIIQTDASQHNHGFQKTVPDVPESLIACGFVHPDSAKSFRDMYRRLSEGENRAEGTFCVRKPDGSGWWYEKILYSAILDEQGNPAKAIAISTDVTAEISDSERMREIVDNVPSGIGIFELFVC